MPQPLSKVKPDAAVVISPAAWHTNANLTRWVCSIIALSSEIDLELSLLLVRILGAEAAPALAMYKALHADNVRLAALNAAAKVALTKEQLCVFDAVLKVAQSAQKTRHKFAHWIWVYSQEVPDAILLADPEHLRQKEIGRSQFTGASLANLLQAEDLDKLLNCFAPPSPEHILVYTEKDLTSEISNFVGATSAFFYFQHYLRPRSANELMKAALDPKDVAMWEDLETSDGALRQLMMIRQFREVYRPASGHTDQNNNHQSQPELPAPPLPEQ